MPIPYRSQQSPINFEEAEQHQFVVPPNYLSWSWPAVLYGTIKGTGKETKYVFNSPPSTAGVTLAGVCYPIAEIHYHAPAEHLDGRPAFPAELHIVHKLPATDKSPDLYAVLGVWLQVGPGDAVVNEFIRAVTSEVVAKKAKSSGAPPANDIPIDLNKLLPTNTNDYYRYEGALTTLHDDDNPETVKWIVFRDAKSVDKQMLADFVAIGHECKGQTVRQSPVRSS